MTNIFIFLGYKFSNLVSTDGLWWGFMKPLQVGQFRRCVWGCSFLGESCIAFTVPKGA